MIRTYRSQSAVFNAFPQSILILLRADRRVTFYHWTDVVVIFIGHAKIMRACLTGYRQSFSLSLFYKINGLGCTWMQNVKTCTEIFWILYCSIYNKSFGSVRTACKKSFIFIRIIGRIYLAGKFFDEVSIFSMYGNRSAGLCNCFEDWIYFTVIHWRYYIRVRRIIIIYQIIIIFAYCISPEEFEGTYTAVG